MSFEAKIKKCVGCGFCCRKSPCIAAVRLHGNGLNGCPELKWDGHRYWCNLCRLPGKVGADYRRELAVGAGCCCGLNSDRWNIPPPQTEIPSQSPELFIVLRALGCNFLSHDCLWLIFRQAEMELGRPGFAEYCMAVATEHRSTFMADFMG